ncbi:MAG: tRNA pseudouridine(55) synthase TruB [Firmicutes bacterium]|nr:tRNA pseudouridine(55) synthase TruB [Bacillota bacterium]
MDGIINVIKPPGMSSFQVVNYIRRLLKVKKVGHTGTLDPGAAGVLPICVGKATRIVPYLIEADKTYVAEMTLGISTTSQDAGGETENLDFDVQISPKHLADAFSKFLGKIQQIPPMASAVRVDGQRLYELERQGITVDRKPRQVVIKEMHINKIWPEEPYLQFGSRILFEVSCSKGTYVRTLCSNLGKELGTVAHMSFLVRTRSGNFQIQQGFTLEEIEEKVQQRDYSFILPIEEALPEFPKVTASPYVEQKIRNGNYVTMDDLISTVKDLTVGDEVLLMNLSGELLALATIRWKDGLICQPTRVLKGV